MTLKVFFTKAAPFGVLWTLTNYLYLHAIKKINTTDASVLFCCNKAFVFLLSWIVLRDRFMGVRVSSAFSVSFPHSCPPNLPLARLASCAGPHAQLLTTLLICSRKEPGGGPVLGVPCKPSCLQTILDKHSLKHLSFQASQQAFPKVCSRQGPSLGMGCARLRTQPEPSAQHACARTVPLPPRPRPRGSEITSLKLRLFVTTET